MNKIRYGLNLRLLARKKQQQPSKLPRPPPFGFNDEDEDDVERDISRQASKNKSLKDIEEQQKKALDEDPTVFDYDGVYDEMKEKAVRPRVQDREERKSRYIEILKEKAKEREQYREVVFERKIAKERSQDDHLYADKDKFVTRAYKKKLAEQAKWQEEERLRERREAKEDVTKKKDLSDFYFNLGKNVAFGANNAELRKPEKQVESRKAEKQPESRELEKLEEKGSIDTSDKGQTSNKSNPPLEASVVEEKHGGETSTLPRSFMSSDAMPVTNTSVEENTSGEQPSSEEPKPNHHKRSGDAVAAAKERYLARKRVKEQFCESRKPEEQVESRKAERQPESRELEKLEEKGFIDTSYKDPPLDASVVEEKHGGETSTLPRSFMSSDAMPVTNTSVEEKTSGEQPSSEEPKPNHHKRSGDAVAAAKERYLARKRAKEQ